MEGDVKIGTPEVSGGNIPEPFNESDERIWMNRILKHMCGETKDCFYPSEFILNEQMQEVKAYDNPEEKERALSNESRPYYNIAKHSLERLTNFMEREIVTRETRFDPTDNKTYVVYCKTSLLNVLCNEISRYDLSDIETILSRLKE
jgi:hypothetical protein